MTRDMLVGSPGRTKAPPLTPFLSSTTPATSRLRRASRGPRHPLDGSDEAFAWIEEAVPVVDRFTHRLHDTRLARALGRELLHPKAVLDGQAIGIEEIQKHAAGRRVTARAVDDRHGSLV